MGNIYDFEKIVENDVIETKPIDHIITAPVAVASMTILSRITNDFCNFYKLGPICKIGTTMISMVLSGKLYLESLSYVTNVRGSIVNYINDTKEGTNGNSET